MDPSTPEIRRHLCVVDRNDSFDTLQLQEQLTVDDEVCSVGAADYMVFVAQ